MADDFAGGPEPQPRAEVNAWNGFVEALRSAGEQVAADTADLSKTEQADGFRALLRSVTNQLGRLEVDRDRPELVAFNQWRQKFLMDNPDFQYWVADIRADGHYRIRGNRGDAAYVSITVYASAGGTDAQATARIDSDTLTFDESGGYQLVLGGDAPADGDWLALPDRATVVWVRHFHNDARTDHIGWCAIDPVVRPEVPPPIDPARFTKQLSKLATATNYLPHIWNAAKAADQAQPNQFRHWEEMSGGAVFTEPGIHYLRGGWELAPDEALLIEGELVDCRFWNILAYSRFLNSLDHRYRNVSYTGATASVVGSHYRFVVAGTDPGVADADWIDTEQRPFGIIVMRFLQPERPPELPVVRRVAIADLPEQS
ncbi:DUF1214 domain-containing protein [Aldersonia kunmingensis]|uniref:DUF1214 domain-containing protein n=1 Tax=Aldersonia kunmingensis TaxID=408066 RepID=UPI00082F13B8|nr:DUF1214 domain-containing protein [Aldersonia kunmingensis]